MLDDVDNGIGIRAVSTTPNSMSSQGLFFSLPPGFESGGPPHHQLVAGYETAGGMLSEMFTSELGISTQLASHQISGDDSAAAAMQLFLTNPPPARSPPQHHHQQGFHHEMTWIPEGQGLSLSLASSLEAAKVEEEFRYGGGGGAHEMMFFDTQHRVSATAASSSNSFGHHHHHHFGFGTTTTTTAATSVFSLSAVNVLRNSKYTRPAQELLEEFCSVGRGHLKKTLPTASTSGSGGGGGGGPSSSSTKVEIPPLSPADRMEHQRRKVKLASMLDEVERRYSHYCEQMQMVVNSFDMVMGFGASVPYTALAQKAMSRHFRCLKDAIQMQLKHSCELLGEKDASGAMGLTKGETPRLKMLEQSLRKQRAFHQMGMMEQEAWRPQRGLPERSVTILRAWLFEHFLNPYPSDADKHLLARQTGLSKNQVANWFINARVRLWKPMIEDMYQQESKERDEENQQEQEERESNNNPQTPTHSPSISAAPPSTTVTTGGGGGGGGGGGSGGGGAITSQIITRHETDPSSSLFIPHPINYNNNINNNNNATSSSWAVANAVGPTTNAQGFIIQTPTTTSYNPNVDECNHFGTTAPSAMVGPTMISFGTHTPTAGDVSLTLGLRHAGGRNPPENSGFSVTDFGRPT